MLLYYISANGLSVYFFSLTMQCNTEQIFAGIDEFYLEPCCLNKLNQRRDHIMEELSKEKECLHKKDSVEYFGEGKYNRARKIIWDLLEKPQTSKTANVSIRCTYSLRIWELYILVQLRCHCP